MEWSGYFSKIPDGDIIESQVATFIYQQTVEDDLLMRRLWEFTAVSALQGQDNQLTGEFSQIFCSELRSHKEKMLTA